MKIYSTVRNDLTHQLTIGSKDGIEVVYMVNPVTRSEVELKPHLRVSDLERFEDFRSAFEQWCTALWRLGRIDPKLFESEYWVHADQELNDGSADENEEHLLTLVSSTFPELFGPDRTRYWEAVSKAVDSVNSEKAEQESKGCELFDGKPVCTCKQ